MRRTAALVLGGLALAACGGTTTTTPTWMPVTCLEAAAAAAQHPSQFAFSCDSHTTFTGVHWDNWGQATARGTGTLNLEGACVPSCSTAPVYRYAVTITASQVALCGPHRSARRIYGLVTVYLPRPDINGARRLTRRLETCVTP